MPDQIIRELKRIQRYARHNEAEDYRFGAFVKTRLSLSNAELDAVVAETTAQVWQQIDCLACGNCCRTLQIVVDDRDIRRLASRLGISPQQFAKQYVATAADGVRHFKQSPCSFLGEDNRCSVYEDRPQACRDFPYLNAGHFRNRVLVTMENQTTCPIVFNVWQSLKKQLGHTPKQSNRKPEPTA